MYINTNIVFMGKITIKQKKQFCFFIVLFIQQQRSINEIKFIHLANLKGGQMLNFYRAQYVCAKFKSCGVSKRYILNGIGFYWITSGGYPLVWDKGEKKTSEKDTLLKKKSRIHIYMHLLLLWAKGKRSKYIYIYVRIVYMHRSTRADKKKKKEN